MRILTVATNDTILSGLQRALGKVADVLIYNPQVNSIYEALYQNKFDLFLVEGHMIKPSIISAIEEFSLSTIVFGHCEHKSAQFVLQLIPEHTLEVTPCVDNYNANVYTVDYAANLDIDCPNYPSSEVVVFNSLRSESDFLSEQLNKLRESQIPFKVVGNPINTSEYVGRVELSDIIGLAKTAKISLCTTHEYIPDIALARGFVYSDIEDPNLVNNLRYYLDNEEERAKTVKNLYSSVLSAHTYFHRLYDIFIKLNLPEEAQKCLQQIANYQS